MRVDKRPGFGDNSGGKMTKRCDINAAAREKLPPAFAKKPGIGSHCVAAFVKPMNARLAGGTGAGRRRKGPKIIA